MLRYGFGDAFEDFNGSRIEDLGEEVAAVPAGFAFRRQARDPIFVLADPCGDAVAAPTQSLRSDTDSPSHLNSGGPLEPSTGYASQGLHRSHHRQRSESPACREGQSAHGRLVALRQMLVVVQVFGWHIILRNLVREYF